MTILLSDVRGDIFSRNALTSSWIRLASNVAEASGGSTSLKRSDFGKLSSILVPLRLNETFRSSEGFTRSYFL